MAFKFKPSHKIAIGFVALMGLGYAGWQGAASMLLAGVTVNSIPPGKVNLVSISEKSGYRIVIANRVAQLREINSGGSYDPNAEKDENSGDDKSVRRLPMPDLIGALEGNQQNLNALVMSVNRLDENELPPDPVIWTAEDLDKAFAGDAALISRLESDLNTRLDGQPVSKINPARLETGIVIDYPVRIEHDGKTLTARIRQEFRTRLVKTVFERIESRANLDDQIMAAVYAEASARVRRGELPAEDVRNSLKSQYSAQRQADLAVIPTRILDNTKVILSDAYFTDAEMRTEETAQQEKTYEIRLSLNEEGRKRLWKFSRENTRFQLVLVNNGLAIAAPRITSELFSSPVVMNRLTDPVLVDEAVRAIKEHSKR